MMGREKEIEEMAKIIARRSAAFRNPNVAFMTTARKTADSIYNADYRKQREVAREIFDEIENNKRFIQDHAGNIGIVVTLQDITELKKKYTESEELE